MSCGLTMRCLQTAFFPQELTGKAAAQGLRKVLAWIVQGEKMAYNNGLHIGLYNIVMTAFLIVLGVQVLRA